MRVTLDLLVVGAGPAGSAAAHAAASGGLRVGVLDRPKPHGKTCGGGIAKEARDSFAICAALAGLECNRPEGLRFEQTGGRALGLLAPGKTAIYHRTELDARLLAAAREAGASVVRARAIDIRREEGGWSVRTESGAELCARFLIGADGAKSTVRRALSAPLPVEHLMVCVVAYLDEPERRDAIFRDCGTEGYLWYFPRANNASLGVAERASRRTIHELRPILERYRRESFPRARVIRRAAGVVPSFSDLRAYREPFSARDWALVGDASGLVEPVTLEGIRFALATGELAGLAACLGDLREYESRWRARWDAKFESSIRAVELRERLVRRGLDDVRSRVLAKSVGF